MNSKIYITRVIKELHEQFPSFNFKYQFDALDRSHVIEYSPFDLVEGDKDFENERVNIICDYIDMNFQESLLFINEFDSLGVPEPELELMGFMNVQPKNINPQLIASFEVPKNDLFECGSDNYALAA